MSTPLTMHRATSEDLPSITSLVAQLNREEGYDMSASMDQLRDAMFAGDARVSMQALVAQRDGRTVGTVLFYWGFDTVSASYGYHLADIVVAPVARAQGIGRALMAALAAQCLQQQGQWVSLTVLKQNARAKQFYLKQGMVEVGVDFLAIGPKGLARCAQI